MPSICSKGANENSKHPLWSASEANRDRQTWQQRRTRLAVRHRSGTRRLRFGPGFDPLPRPRESAGTTRVARRMEFELRYYSTCPLAEANRERKRTAELRNREQRGPQRHLGRVPVVSGSSSGKGNRRNPAKRREFPRLTRASAQRTPETQTTAGQPHRPGREPVVSGSQTKRGAVETPRSGGNFPGSLALRLYEPRRRRLLGGESGIRTHGTLTGTRALQARALSRSAISPKLAKIKRLGRLAEREGFEPSIRFPVCRFSKPVPSATRPPLRGEAAG
jgi:hypothetical protein